MILNTIKHYWAAVVGATLLTSVLMMSCGSDEKNVVTTKDKMPAASDFALTQTELALAKSEKPYLFIDLAHKQLCLRMKGALVWNCPVTIVDTDADELTSFARKFASGDRRLVRPVVERYLFTAKEKTPDSVLQIVGKVVNVDPERLQREIPGRFQLLWGDGLVLEIHSDIKADSKTNFKTTMVDLSQKIQKPFGEDKIIVQVSPDDAMTLYRVCVPGFPTLIPPPK